ncbi:MAG: hypothetical protein QOH47_976 [Sphingomonadales bacterium]|nr:hypothetical protein [Sphingomonadales bacterium]
MAKQTKLPVATGAKPTHRLYQVSGDGKTASWREIGAAWPNKDGAGFSLACNAIPLGGRIVMRAITERPAAEALQ